MAQPSVMARPDRATGPHHPYGAGNTGSVVRAVAVRHLVEVLLVVVLGEVELPGRHDLCGDLAVPRLSEAFLVRRGGLLRLRLLLRAVIEDRGPVLRAEVVAL